MDETSTPPLSLTDGGILVETSGKNCVIQICRSLRVQHVFHVQHDVFQELVMTLYGKLDPIRIVLHSDITYDLEEFQGYTLVSIWHRIPVLEYQVVERNGKRGLTYLVKVGNQVHVCATLLDETNSFVELEENL